VIFRRLFPLADRPVHGRLTPTRQRSALPHLTRDGWLLLVTRFARLFAYGALSVVLVLYLNRLGLSTSQTGVLLTLTLVGDTLVSLWLTAYADRLGRRRVLQIGAILMAAAGLVFASTGNLLLLLIAGTVGIMSPSGNEVGPFLSIEQAALSQVVPPRRRTATFAWYTMAGSLATATGSLFPTRQSYTMAVVRPEERSATAGVTGVARTTGAAMAPLFAGFLFARPALMSAPFFLAGALKALYDLLLYREFSRILPPEETTEK
jgi:MFS family permease